MLTWPTYTRGQNIRAHVAWVVLPVARPADLEPLAHAWCLPAAPVECEVPFEVFADVSR